MSCVQKASTLARQDHDRLFSEKERRKHPNEKMDKGFIFVGLDKKGVNEVSDTEEHEHFAPDMALYSLAYLSKMMQNIERNMEVQE